MKPYDYSLELKLTRACAGRSKHVTVEKQELLSYIASCYSVSLERGVLNWNLAGALQELNYLRSENRFLIGLLQERANVVFAKTGGLITPPEGLVEHSLYLVEASCSPNNPIHQAYLMVGFLNTTEKGWRQLGGYTQLMTLNGSIHDKRYYVKVLKLLHTNNKEVVNDTF